MDLGKPQRIITVEPEPVEVPVQEPQPVREPALVPARPDTEKER